MSQITDTTYIENDDLICPITLELFHDPVIAKDGRAYEREAITKWILEHGTSPFTREPLQINDLRSDDRLRRLAVQRRNSTVFYNARNDSVILPPLRRVPRNNTRTSPEEDLNLIRANPYQLKKCSPLKFCSIIILFIIIISFSFGLMFSIRSSNSNSTESEIISNYSNSLTSNSSVFIRPWMNNGSFYYQAIQVIVSINGFYKFKSVSGIDMYGCLYTQYFNNTNSYINLLMSDDDSGGNLQFYLQISLQSGNYVLLATTYSRNVTGPFSVLVIGPATVILR